MQDLDRDAPLDQRVLGEEHRAHPALTERLDDPVPPLDHVPCLHDRVPRSIWVRLFQGTSRRAEIRSLDQPELRPRWRQRVGDLAVGVA